MPLVQTRGAASAQGFGEFAQASAGAVNYIEDVFSTYLYSGTNASQTITNNIDLSGKGGLVWQKQRTSAISHRLFNTVQTLGNELASNSASAVTNAGNLTAFSSTGFTVASSISDVGETYVTWTFRKQEKFFDIVTYTGNGTAGRTIAHNLGSTPGCVMIKTTSASQNWLVYHRSLAGGIQTANPCNVMYLNGTDASLNQGSGPTNANATSITLSDNWENSNGVSYVMYLFAHNAGGFGLTSTDNVISCGSFTTDGSGNATVNLGYEPQWLLTKVTDTADNWVLVDTMRGWTASNTCQHLRPNTSGAEISSSGFSVTSTGFTAAQGGGPFTYIYIAIRRGPMKVPTSGTSVFSPVARTGTGATAQITGIGFTPDFIIGKPRTGYNVGTAEFDRLKGVTKYLAPSWIDDEITDTTMVTSFNMDGVSLGADTTQKYFNGSAGTYINWIFKRAPSFFDEVCYTGTGNNTTIAHNLGVVPELIFVKCRSAARAWDSYSSALANTEYIVLNSTAAKATGATRWNSTTPTSSVFSVGTATTTNANTSTYVAFLFATCAGVSKVGSYTGTGTTKQVDCGFTGGARFVLIKRTDSTGDWYVWDSARGLVAGNDPYLLLNSADDEVTSTDYVDTYNAGFEISSTAPAAINASAGSFIFLAIA